ncbi:glycosyl transferase family 2 [Peptoclostridium acidaminophilum DSM 3953]|uniref:4,4'-diaponeurosporenoate glycosyltransferase n=1 Tax=Peptoclostridium acidaminophilum DSM 3953 TaxID=1286171 RepID=W8T838_PEPAC|nr:TIGR04283 family arsenosugar biosynthesis glycosyltransferase [Peptoclostridium acidaminophilum]AHM57045.1 glycosyl transferase family 2 [Peptoclostridium acidaminophilum DSM 3953]
MISIIVPVLNEEKTIERLLLELKALEGEKEIIVADGGSTDSTAKIASQHSRLTGGVSGRARQMNKGAGIAKGDILWFVHSDSSVDRSSLCHIKATVEEGFAGGGFSMFFHDYDTPLMRFIACSSNMRARHMGLYFGDQGIFVRREIFERIGGYPDIPLMEDWELGRTLKNEGKMKLLNAQIGTSGRRFKNGGALRTLLFMHKIKLLYMLGTSPEKLSSSYRKVR